MEETQVITKEQAEDHTDWLEKSEYEKFYQILWAYVNRSLPTPIVEAVDSHLKNECVLCGYLNARIRQINEEDKALIDNPITPEEMRAYEALVEKIMKVDEPRNKR